MASYGTTTVEAKSGYGLSFEAEIKSLEAIAEAARQWQGTVVPTLLGAHVVAPEYRENPEEYVRIVCEEMIPAVSRGGLKPAEGKKEGDSGAPEGIPLQMRRRVAESVDQCPEAGGVCRCVLRARSLYRAAVAAHPARRRRSRSRRPRPCLPADAGGTCSSARVPSRLARSHGFRQRCRSHDLWRKSDTVATLLPAANYFLGLQSFPPARKLIDAGVAVALATDYNPGTAPTPSMPFVLSAACTHMKMSPAEAITAATYNGACALRLQATKGSLEPGKDADIAIFDASDYRELAYWFGVNRCWGTVLKGAWRDRRSLSVRCSATEARSALGMTIRKVRRSALGMTIRSLVLADGR